MLNLEAQRLMLAIAKKILDENHFKAAHKMMDRTPSTSPLNRRQSIFQKQTAQQMGS